MKYHVYIPAYSQTFEAKDEVEAIELFNESVDTLQGNDDDMMSVKAEIVPMSRKELSHDGYYPIARLHRDDLTGLSSPYSQEEADAVTDDQLIEIAEAMSDGYMESGYWESLSAAAEMVIGDPKSN